MGKNNQKKIKAIPNRNVIRQFIKGKEKSAVLPFKKVSKQKCLPLPLQKKLPLNCGTSREE